MKRLLAILAGFLFGSFALAQSYPGDGQAAIGIPAPVGNDPPIWNATPNPSATEAVASSHDLLQYVTDPEGDTITFAEETGCTYPTGVTLDNPNKELDFSTGTSAGTTTGCVLSADDSTNPKVNSAAFGVEIFAVGGAHLVNGAGGDDFTTINACIAQVACGETCQVKNGTYQEHMVTNGSCSAGNEITIEAFAAHAPVVTPSSGTAHFTCNHQYWIVGDGISFEGTNPGTQGVAPTGNPNPGVQLNSGCDNLVWKGDVKDSQFRWMRIERGVTNLRLDDTRFFVAGNSDNGGNDVGDAISMPDGTPSTNTDYLFENSYHSEGGHATHWFQDAQRVWLDEFVTTNNWSEYVYLSGDITGNRSLSFKGVDDLVWRGLVSFDTRKAVDSGSNGGQKIQSTNISFSEVFLLDHQIDGGSGECVAINAQNNGGGTWGWDNVYIDHATFHSCDGAFIRVTDNGGDDAGEIHIKNIIVNNIGGTCIDIKFDSGESPPRDDWENWFFLESAVFDQDCTLRLTNDGGANPDNILLSQALITYPANFKDIEFEEPAFSSETLPTCCDAATVLSTTRTNFTPSSTNTLNGGIALTTVNGAQSTDTLIEVAADGARWFRSNMGWSHKTGDQITLCGSTVTVTDYNLAGDTITVSSAITCSGGEGIFRGTDTTPNLGAVIN